MDQGARKVVKVATGHHANKQNGPGWSIESLSLSDCCSVCSVAGRQLPANTLASALFPPNGKARSANAHTHTHTINIITSDRAGPVLSLSLLFKCLSQCATAVQWPKYLPNAVVMVNAPIAHTHFFGHSSSNRKWQMAKRRRKCAGSKLQNGDSRCVLC